MDKEFAFGGVIFRKEKGRVFFLAIYSGRNRIWGFPKGHIEPGESEDRAALREIEEETGLAGLKKIAGFRRESVYQKVSKRPPFKGRIVEKHSVYFLYETRESGITVDGHEITGYKWLPAREIFPLLPFESLKDILRSAQSAVQQYGFPLSRE